MIDSSTPLVSVACMAYNHEKYIKNTLDGFVMQETNFPFEVIINDDASTDGTADIIREYEAKYPHIIKAIYQTENQYSQKNWPYRNIIFPKTKGKYIAFCEGDDFWTHKHKLQKQADYMESHPECPCVFHAVNVMVKEKIARINTKGNVERDFTANDVIRNGGDFIPSPAIFYKRELYDHWPKFREVANTGDYPLQIWLALNGNVHYLPEVMATYRFMSEGSWSQKVMTDPKFLSNHCFAAIKWLTQLNIDTQGKYHVAISYEVFKNMRLMVSRNVLPKDHPIYKLCMATERMLAESSDRIIGEVVNKFKINDVKVNTLNK
ncbi:MAG: glycosyltransferase family 2 protein [Selenomonadaceae bacterium]|nr:glycosyltransferase family 2 protein [Selenomonadaceae bacterium]